MPARLAALDALHQVLDRGRPLDSAIDGHPGWPALPDRDRAFARQLVATTLRRLGQIDALIGRRLARPLPPESARVQHILRLATAQLAFLGTPPHAAVTTAVDMARRRRRSGHAALINAVLRRIAVEAAEEIAGHDAARLNTPGWLWESWTAAYGGRMARAIAEAHLGEPPLDLTPKEPADPALAARLGATLLPTGTMRIIGPQGPVAALPGFAAGAWWVQDAAAALPVRLLGDVRGRTVYDLCAAPGGKTAQLAAAGARVTAVDQSQSRLDRLAANLARLGLTAVPAVADARHWQPPPAARPADILLDVPCSATGTIRRHPDVARLKRPEDIAALASLQMELAVHAARLLAPGGRLIYCACSLEPEEGPALIARLLAAEPGLVRLPVAAAEIGGLAELIDATGDLRTLPAQMRDAGGLDGFYACRLVRPA